MKRVMVAACACTAALMTAFAPAASAHQGHGHHHGGPASADEASAALQKAVKVRGIRHHQWVLQKIADANGGNRFAGRPGHDASARYVFKTLKKAGWQVAYQEFPYLGFFEDAPTTLATTEPAAEVPTTVMEYSGAGEVTGALEAPSGDPLGCVAADWTGFTAGNVAYAQRGTCPFRDKVTNAAAAGASAIVIVNNIPGELAGTLGAADGQATIPAVGVAPEDAEAAGLAAGVSVHITVVAHTEDLTTRNVIAETPGGDPDNVVMAGGHLDSVIKGPGINDDGSGSAALLELAQKIRKAGPLRNKIRLAWWSAEESGLVGSNFYTDPANLPDADAAKIALYLNFDMIASPNFVRFIYDGDDPDAGAPAGSGAIEANFAAFFDAAGLAHEPTPFDGRSDYGGFLTRDIAAGGLFTGAEDIKTPEQAAIYGGTAGQAFDPCYHQACDDFDNNNEQVLGEMSDAIADQIARYGYSTSAVNGQPDLPPGDGHGHGHGGHGHGGHGHGGHGHGGHGHGRAFKAAGPSLRR